MMDLDKLLRIKAFVFDVDGVLTDGSVLVTEGGQLLRRMSVRDGYALKKLIELKIPVACITGGSSQGVIKRLQGLGLRDIYAGIEHKLPVLDSWLQKYNLSYADILYMGDDMPDYETIKLAGCAACPADADIEILRIAHVVTSAKGGRGCVREVIEKVLRVQERWPV